MLSQLFSSQFVESSVDYVPGRVITISEIFKSELNETAHQLKDHLEASSLDDIVILPGRFGDDLVIATYKKGERVDRYFYGSDLGFINDKKGILAIADKWEVVFDSGTGGELFAISNL